MQKRLGHHHLSGDQKLKDSGCKNWKKIGDRKAEHEALLYMKSKVERVEK